MNLDSHLTKLTMLKLDPSSLMIACQTNKLTQSICNDNGFWAQKLEIDFPGALPYKLHSRPNQDWYWMLVNHPINYENIQMVIDNGDWDLLKYMVAMGVELDQDIIDQVIDLNTLIFLEQRGYYPSVIGANLVAQVGDLDILDWLELRNIYPDENATINAFMNNDIGTFNWLVERGIQLPDGVNGLF